MRKILSVILILALGWLAKLSYDMFQISQQLPVLQQNLLKLDQNNAKLNDQLVALQRQIVTAPEQHSPSSAPVTNAAFRANPVVLIKQQLEFVEFALQQQQYTLAVEKLNELDQSLGLFNLAPTLKDSLHVALAQDRQTIQQVVNVKSAQREQFNALISQMDKLLQQAGHQSRVELDRSDTTYFWQGWFQFEKVQQPSANLMNRQLVFKEVQLRLILAKQALNLGQVTEYQTTIQTIIEQIGQLPDKNSQQLKSKFEKLKQVPVVPVPKLAALALIG
ncbi:hypothetical protein [Acinetobacter soli]|uniref:hypothetical protein n=1 Tax=Acinetobacter soli TaxID=487316 RepID=UPI00370A58F7